MDGIFIFRRTHEERTEILQEIWLLASINGASKAGYHKTKETTIFVISGKRMAGEARLETKALSLTKRSLCKVASKISLLAILSKHDLLERSSSH